MLRKRITYRYKVCRIRRQTLFVLFAIVSLVGYSAQSKTYEVYNEVNTDLLSAGISALDGQEQEEEIEESEEEDVDDDSEIDEEVDTDDADDMDDGAESSDDEDLPFALSVAADVFSQRMAKGTSISGGDPTLSPSIDLSHVSGFSAGFSIDQSIGSAIRFQAASIYLDYEYELSDYFGVGATYTHGFYSASDTSIFANAKDQITLYSDFYWNGLLAGIDVDYYFGDNKLLYFSASLGYSFDITDDLRMTPSAGAAMSYNETTQGKSKGSKGKTKQQVAFSNAYLGISASYELGRGFSANASIRGIYSKEETSNKKTTQFSAMVGVSYDLEF